MIGTPAVTHPTYFGLQLYELLTLGVILLGPVLAVWLTVWAGNRGRRIEQRTQILRMLITTYHLPSDPTFQVAINLVRIEFRGCAKVLEAHREFIDEAGKPDGQTGIKSVRLIHEMAKVLRYDLRETDLQTMPYSSRGWGERERLHLDSQQAMRDIATLLTLQTKHLLGAALSNDELKLLGLERREPNA